MALSPAQRKTLLGFGGLKRVADALGMTEGHVSQVNSESRQDPTEKVRRAITDDIRGRLQEQGLPLLDHEDIWGPAEPDRAVAAIVAGAKGR